MNNQITFAQLPGRLQQEVIQSTDLFERLAKAKTREERLKILNTAFTT
jgi:hypothetical protein